MASNKGITIIGGGLSGLTLGISLRQQGVPVELWEAGAYPRHRVCGEFISGRGLQVLHSLELSDDLRKAGARTAKTAAMVFGNRICPQHLPEPALCVSRFRLDQLLADKLVELGGRLRVGVRFAGTIAAEGWVRATGRAVQPVQDGRHWFGLKAHARKVSLCADLEMHYLSDAYVGLCRLDEETVNVCGLFRRRKADPGRHREATEMLKGSEGHLLFERLRQAEWDKESICAVAGLSFGTLPNMRTLPCCVGDVFRMIPPLTGNGMSIAFESAELALGPLAAYSSGRMSWSDTESKLRDAYKREFQSRFFWAHLLQTLAFSPAARMGGLLMRAPALFRWCFAKTR